MVLNPGLRVVKRRIFKRPRPHSGENHPGAHGKISFVSLRFRGAGDRSPKIFILFREALWQQFKNETPAVISGGFFMGKTLWRSPQFLGKVELFSLEKPRDLLSPNTMAISLSRCGFLNEKPLIKSPALVWESVRLNCARRNFPRAVVPQ